MQSPDELSLIKEAKIFTQYIIGEEVDEQSIQLYISANNKLALTLSDKENKRLKFLLNRPSFIGMADGALALTHAESGIRKKIYLMFSVLESRPQFFAYFLPMENKTPLLSIIGSGIRASFNTTIGLILLPWI